MEDRPLFFWNPGPNLRLSPAEVARELTFGEEVEGLIDLPVREILGRIKEAFPQHNEQSGLLTGQGAAGSFEVTWTWQFLQAKLHDLPAADRQRLIDVIEEAGCMAYDGR